MKVLLKTKQNDNSYLSGAWTHREIKVETD